MAGSIRDILLLMTSYPTPTPDSAIDAALALAERFDARVTAMLCRVHLPQVGNWLADKLIHANEVIASENRKSRDAAQHLLEELARRVGERGGEHLVIDCKSLATTNELARHARAHDLTIVKVQPEPEQRYALEGLIFGSGRPILLLPAAEAARHLHECVVIGWDGSRAAARAVADALPFCRLAKSVHVVAVTGEKVLNTAESLRDIERHLLYHGIHPIVEEVRSEGRDAGTALVERSTQLAADLLVMGAYGHSKAREFVLGGATETVLKNPRIAVLLSH